MSAVTLVVPETELCTGFRGILPEPGGADELVLLRRPEVAGDTPSVLAAARALGARCVTLPDDTELAAWVVATAVRWVADDEDRIDRALLALVSMLPPASGMPTRRWGGSGVRVPALPSRILARFARLAFIRCPHCLGGGVEGGVCGRCGVPLQVAA